MARSILGSAPVETVNCNTAPPVTSDDIPRGGSGLISDQAACPFRAFANYRLGTRKLEEAELGFDARVRGMLMHRCLELFWNEVRSSDRLLSLGEQGRRAENDARRLGELRRQTLCVLSVRTGEHAAAFPCHRGQVDAVHESGRAGVALQVVKRKGFNLIDTAALVRDEVAAAAAFLLSPDSTRSLPESLRR